MLIHGGTIINEGRTFKGDILIQNDRIEKIIEGGITEIPKGVKVIDATGKFIIPGVIDDQVHFREPGLTHKGDIGEGSRAAAAGGVTSFMDMPNVKPPTVTNELLREKQQIARENAVVNYSFYLGATVDNIDEIRNIDPHATRGVSIPIHHCSNSAGIVDIPEANMDMVRAGITLYGMWPSEDVDKTAISLKPALSLVTHVAYVKELPAGRAISYGGTYVTKEPRMIATIPVGYADGYARGLSNKGAVLIHGRRAPILGRVCMDQFMVDVTDIPGVKNEDEVILIGRDGDECITMEEVGGLSGRFNYEFACDLGKRIPRVYIHGGRIIGTRDHFSE